MPGEVAVDIFIEAVFPFVCLLYNIVLGFCYDAKKYKRN